MLQKDGIEQFYTQSKRPQKSAHCFTMRRHSILVHSIEELVVHTPLMELDRFFAEGAAH